MKIVKFEAENVKRIKAVEITPDGSMVIIGGKNGQGKSSVLDSIMAAIGGKKFEDSKMVRDGKKKGYVELDLGELIVRRTFTKTGGGLLTIKAQDGSKLASPQAILDGLIGQVSFDPLSFVRANEKEQGEMIRELAGLDMTEIDEARQELYDDRTFTNREIKTMEADLDKLVFHDDPGYQEEIDTQALLSELEKDYDCNHLRKVYIEDIDKFQEDTAKNILLIEEYKEKIKALEATNKSNTEDIEMRQEYLEANPEVDLEPKREQLASSESHNKIVQSNIDFKEAQAKLDAKVDDAEKLTTEIKEKDSEKEKMIQAAPMPIQGLSFDSEGILTYQDIPFSQASQAECIRVSVSIGISMNPKLKVLLIKDGSFLDEDNLKMIGKMAQLTDSQLWVETVGTRDGVSVIMEDGISKDVVSE